jgi:hypothetical protein
MGALLHTAITAPPHRQPTSGLLALATPYPEPPVEWPAGFAFDPETCTDPIIQAVECAVAETKPRSTNPATVEYAPFGVIGNSWCSTLTGNVRNADQRAGRHLLASQSWAFERVLWTGVATGDSPNDGTVRPHLADGRATVLADADDLAHAVARMDQALTDCLWNQQGMIHMAPISLARAKDAGVVEREAGMWISPNGHKIVAGGGYTGGGPRPTVGGALPAAPDLLAEPIPAHFIYGTGPVFYLLGDSFTVSEIVREVNDSNARAERPGAAFYGPCCQFAVEVVAET